MAGLARTDKHFGVRSHLDKTLLFSKRYEDDWYRSFRFDPYVGSYVVAVMTCACDALDKKERKERDGVASLGRLSRWLGLAGFRFMVCPSPIPRGANNH